jgi:hypothetical protein
VHFLAPEHLRLDRVALGQITEPAGEGDLRLVVKVLVGEEDHQPLEPDHPDGGDLLVAERCGAIDAPDLGADGGAEVSDVERDVGACHDRKSDPQ